MSVFMELQPFIAQTAPADLYADVRLGDNGDIFGMTEYDLYTAADGAGGYETWDVPGLNSVDSGWVGVQLDVHTGGQSTWYVQGGEDGVLAISVPPSNGIRQVVVEAVAGTAGVSFQWQNIVAEFYHNGRLSETIEVSAALQPQADTTVSGQAQEAITRIIPQNPNSDELVLTAMIRIHTNPNVFPAGDQVFGQVLINPA